MNAPLFSPDRAPRPGPRQTPDLAPALAPDLAPATGPVATAGAGPLPAAPRAPANAGLAEDPTATGQPLTIGWVTSLVLLLGFGGWAVFASIEGAIVAPGQVEAARTRLSIQHPDGGRLAELAVAEGEAVAAGALLARLDAGLLEAERTIVETQFLEALARQARLQAERDGIPPSATPLSVATVSGAQALSAAERARLAPLLEGQDRLMTARQETLGQQLAQLGLRRAQALAQRNGLEAQIAAIEAEADLVAAEIAQQARLVAQGLAPDARLTALRREAARLQGTQAAGTAERAAVAGRITEIDLQILALEAGRREEAEAALRDLGVTLVELATRRNLLDARLARLEIRAPTAGRIHGLSLGGPGTVLRPAEPLAELVPALTEPIVILHLRPEDIDRVRPGQPVRLLLPANGARDRPELTGHVAQVSADLVEDPRHGAAHFRAEIALSPPEGAGPGASPSPHGAASDRPGPEAVPRLHPGTPVEGYIRTGSRTPLQWLLAPITAQLGRAMRDD